MKKSESIIFTRWNSSRTTELDTFKISGTNFDLILSYKEMKFHFYVCSAFSYVNTDAFEGSKIELYFAFFVHLLILYNLPEIASL